MAQANPQKKGVVLSGMRPTGKLHIGHLEGVLRDWVSLQDNHTCHYFVADWHAITTNPNTKELRENTIDMVKDWLAFGIDPEKSVVFVQSRVPEHAELSLLFSMLVNLGRLERLPTFIDYMKNVLHADEGDVKVYDEVKRANVSLGFLGYPVLQAADILMYKTTVVPVGSDQLPHIELAREIARRFNNTYGELFPIPEGVVGRSPRILGFDGKKMSKSLGNTIEPTDDLGAVTEKVMKMITDPDRIRATDKGNPYICSVYDLHEIYNPEHRAVAAMCLAGERGCIACKKDLAPRVHTRYDGFRKIKQGLTDSFVLDVLDAGSKAAKLTAEGTMGDVRNFMLLDYFKKQ